MDLVNQYLKKKMVVQFLRHRKIANFIKHLRRSYIMCNYNGQYSLPTNCYKIQFIFDFFSVCVSGARVLMTIRDAVSRIGYHVHI